jgi:hypothetical protein
MKTKILGMIFLFGLIILAPLNLSFAEVNDTMEETEGHWQPPLANDSPVNSSEGYNGGAAGDYLEGTPVNLEDNSGSGSIDWNGGLSSLSISTGQSGQGWNLGRLTSFGLPGGSVYGIVTNVLYWLLALFGFISVIGFVIAGILYLTAAGSETQMEKAKKAMTYAIIGVIVGLSGVVVIQAVSMMLSGGMFFMFF